MSLLILIRTALKESWEQKTDRWGFKNEWERKWNMKTGGGIFNKPLEEFCPGYREAGSQLEEVWSQRRCMCLRMCVCLHLCVRVHAGICVHENREDLS